MKTHVQLWYLDEFFLKRETFHTKFVEEIKTHILCSIIFFFSKNRAVCDNVEKYGTVGEAG
jgi:hypothetical protein